MYVDGIQAIVTLINEKLPKILNDLKHIIYRMINDTMTASKDNYKRVSSRLKRLRLSSRRHNIKKKVRPNHYGHILFNLP